MRTQARTLITVAAVLAGMAAAPPVFPDNSGTIICWTDDHGQRFCGDHVPAQYSQKQRDVFDQRGVLVQTFKAEQTAEQRAADERKQRDAEHAQEQQQQQQQNDSFLMQTYSSVTQLREMRDSRLQTFDVRIDLATKAVRDGAESLKDLQDRADDDHTAGRDPDPKLLAQIKNFENSQADNIRVLARIQQDRDVASTQFEHDIQRYQELRSASTPPPPPTPQAPQPVQASAPSPAPKP